jgi:hypothetical protein
MPFPSQSCFRRQSFTCSRDGASPGYHLSFLDYSMVVDRTHVQVSVNHNRLASPCRVVQYLVRANNMEAEGGNNQDRMNS